MKARSGKVIVTPLQLRRAISRLSPASPVTNRFSARWRKLGRRGGGQQEQRVVWYKTQHEHWLGWLKEYGGPGADNRKNANRSSEYVYNHIVNPQMLVYLAEAAKVKRALISRATKAALANRVSMSAMSSAIRNVLPWCVVEESLVNFLIAMNATRPSPRPHGKPRRRTNRSTVRAKASQAAAILHLNLHREFFGQIAARTKRIEYRERTPYWAKRLEGRDYDIIQFRNGYATKAPVMQVQYRGVRKIRKWGAPCYAIQLGRVLSIKRWKAE